MMDQLRDQKLGEPLLLQQLSTEQDSTCYRWAEQ